MIVALEEIAIPVGRAAAIHFFLELGQRSFAVIAILSAWCPVSGIRGGREWVIQVIFAGLASLIAVALPVVLWPIATARFSNLHSGLHPWVAPALLAGLAAKAFYDFREADKEGRPWQRSASLLQGFGSYASSGAGPAAAQQFVEASGEAGCYINGFKPYDPSGKQAALGAGWGTFRETYGSMAAAPPRVEPTVQPMLSMAFFVPLTAVLAVTMNDGQPLHEEATGLLVASSVGTVLGLATAVFAAVLVGFLLERQLSDRRFLLVAFLVLGALSIGTFSGALVHAMVSAEAAGRAVISFLSLSALPTEHAHHA